MMKGCQHAIHRCSSPRAIHRKRLALSYHTESASRKKKAPRATKQLESAPRKQIESVSHYKSRAPRATKLKAPSSRKLLALFAKKSNGPSLSA
eukprot:202863-Pleurochrysis_carterae.AAC.5